MPAVAVDLTGRVFGKLTVERRSGTASDGSAIWQCRCQCGGTRNAASYDLSRSRATMCATCSRRAAAAKRSAGKPPKLATTPAEKPPRVRRELTAGAPLALPELPRLPTGIRRRIREGIELRTLQESLLFNEWRVAEARRKAVEAERKRLRKQHALCSG